MSFHINIVDLLEELDGAGLIITNIDEVKEELTEMGISLDSHIPYDAEPEEDSMPFKMKLENGIVESMAMLTKSKINRADISCKRKGNNMFDTSDKIVFDKEIVDKLKEYIDNCDADELARLAGEAFGGECYCTEDNQYVFSPNGNYTGDFDKVS